MKDPQIPTRSLSAGRNVRLPHREQCVETNQHLPHRQLRMLVALAAAMFHLLLICSPSQAATTIDELKQREQRVRDVVRKVLPCTVCLETSEGSGSGVIVMPVK